VVRIIDNAPPNSVAFREAAAELATIAKEARRLALKTDDQNLIKEAEASFQMVRGFEKR
jgi:hypothetical protein